MNKEAAKKLARAALNAAVAHIHEKLRIDEPDIAKSFFDGSNGLIIEELLSNYIETEIEQLKVELRALAKPVHISSDEYYRERIAPLEMQCTGTYVRDEFSSAPAVLIHDEFTACPVHDQTVKRVVKRKPMRLDLDKAEREFAEAHGLLEEPTEVIRAAFLKDAP